MFLEIDSSKSKTKESKMIRIFQSSCCFNGFLKGKSSTHSNVKLTVTVRKYIHLQSRKADNFHYSWWKWDMLTLRHVYSVHLSTRSSSGYEGEGSRHSQWWLPEYHIPNLPSISTRYIVVVQKHRYWSIILYIKIHMLPN